MLSTTLIFTVVYLFSSQLCSAWSRYGYEYVPTAYGWLRLHTVPSTWADARLHCQLEGGILASPTSSPLAAAMIKMMNEANWTQNKVYTGINALIAKGDFVTIDGLPLSKISSSWAAGEPHNHEDSEDCVAMNGVGELAYVNCSRLFGYFCFKETAKMTFSTCETWDPAYQKDTRTGSCYKLHKDAQDWHRAALTCRAEEGHLAVINSDTEAQVLKELFATLPQNETLQYNRNMVFIGFWDWTKKGDWQTIFGQTLAEAGFSGWNDDEPNNYTGSEYCGTMHRNGRLNDFPCDIKAVFICEIML